MAAKAAEAGAQDHTETASTTQKTDATTSQQGDGKTGATKTAGTGGEEKKAEKASAQGTDGSSTGKAGETTSQPKAPAKYELTLPAGGRVQDVHRSQIETMARANDWSNDDAQAAVDELDAQLKAQTESFLVTTKADKDYGGDKLTESQRFAKLAIDRIRPEGHARRDAFLNLLNGSGYGNHIEVVAFFADLGRQMGEDRGSAGAGGASGSKDPADAMYDHPTSRKLAGS